MFDSTVRLPENIEYSARTTIPGSLAMAQTAINPTMRSLIVILAVVAGILAFAIYVAANSPGRLRAEAALATAKSKGEEARKDASKRIETLERENADLEKQLELAMVNLDQGAEKLAAAEQEVLRLRGDLNAALKQVKLKRRRRARRRPAMRNERPGSMPRPQKRKPPWQPVKPRSPRLTPRMPAIRKRP